ncbi:thioredoxin domain-containing protein [Cryobacterium roopkundense]|uniref:Protein-disulfide isomerase n=1 Tax=Cryobacterium roopkundense TaxID=1001240 RepID=A0A7W9E4F3_9MICO|nr:thioredoxin domain-containing protein [Cryobacterium roopkundense]MBB5642622.1 protein-disulfide isomerase [Cryobacterium roopkundense]
MTSHASGQPRPTKAERREHAREQARQQRDQEEKRTKRRRVLWRGGIGLGLVAVTAVAALLIANQAGPSAAGPLNMSSDGILLGGDGTLITAARTAALAPGAKPVATDQSALTDMVKIAIYVDYLCPLCGQFESTNAAQITSWVTAGNATVELHPISVLDASSLGTKYSTRAANAAACVANFAPNSFLTVNAALLANQPAENSGGLSDAELQQVIEDAGVGDAKIADCIGNQTFATWVAAASDRALSGPLANADIEKITGTPTVLVNQVSYTGSLTDAAAFEAFVTAQTVVSDN